MILNQCRDFGAAPSLYIAIIDGSHDRVALILEVLAEMGAKCQSYSSLDQFMDAGAHQSCDLIVLGEELPGISPIEVLCRVRRDASTKEIPVLILGSGDDTIQVSMIDAGADSYETWPIASSLLAARVRAILRLREGSMIGFAQEVYGPYAFDRTLKTVTIKGRVVRLTEREFKIAIAIFRRQSEYVSIEKLFELAWPEFVCPRTVRHTVAVHVHRIRRKLELYGELGYTLNYVSNLGYQLMKVEVAAQIQPVG
ncbi:response regulator transcription factor [Burkholderia ubonensis]|uniref:response regulator transcription factor n=1 Tax=Burkholderia ubonensis TaxID=101571 RepID=UPI000A934954|nr:response regulator transcription factor [Burkholderia ubonensis]